DAADRRTKWPRLEPGALFGFAHRPGCLQQDSGDPGAVPAFGFSGEEMQLTRDTPLWADATAAATKYKGSHDRSGPAQLRARGPAGRTGKVPLLTRLGLVAWSPAPSLSARPTWLAAAVTANLRKCRTDGPRGQDDLAPK